MIILLSATMWLHIRTDEGVSAASAPQSAPLPSYCAQQRLRGCVEERLGLTHPPGAAEETPAAATVDPDQVRRGSAGSETPPEPLSSELSAAQSAIRLHQRETRGSGEAVCTQPRVSRRGAERAEQKEIKESPGGVGVEHPPWTFLPFLSRRFASVGHVGAPICPSASAELPDI